MSVHGADHDAIARDYRQGGSGPRGADYFKTWMDVGKVAEEEGVSEPRKVKIDLLYVANRSHANRERMKLFRETLDDARRPERLAKAECRACFYYSGRVGGAMSTSALCGLCGEEMRFGSTCVDVLCPKCAAGKRLCRHCGGDVDDKARRKL